MTGENDSQDMGAPFALLDEAAIAAAELRHDPYDFVSVNQAIAPECKDGILADAPHIPHPGSYDLSSLKVGPGFEAVIQDLLSPRFRHLVERKFDLDLSDRPPSIVMMGNAGRGQQEGRAHTGSRHKIITVLLGFSPDGPPDGSCAGGSLRVLRRENREDYIFEFSPVFGQMLILRIGAHSWHSVLSRGQARLCLQLSFGDSKWYVWREHWRHRTSAVAKSFPIVGKIIEWIRP